MSKHRHPFGVGDLVTRQWNGDKPHYEVTHVDDYGLHTRDVDTGLPAIIPHSVHVCRART